MKKGLLLINLGTPDSPSVADVRRYLAEFLSDNRVLDLPAPVRYALLFGFILPFRPKMASHAYQSIWTDSGSPLLINSKNLARKLEERLKGQCLVALGMRYGKPSIASALESLSGCDHITVLPLFPQYSSAVTGSAIERLFSLLSIKNQIPSLHIIRDFYREPAFLQAQASLIKPAVNAHDFILFSYHGLPERQLKKSGCQLLCQSRCAPGYHFCYRAQCQATSDALAGILQLSEKQYGMAFQSRLGRTPWIRPYLEEELKVLIQQGIRRIAVVCPSFTADCLETLEEVGIRAQQQWMEAGGEQFTLIPCVNDNESWVQGIINLCGLDRLNNQ